MTATPPHTDTSPGTPAHRDGNVLRWLTAYTASMVGDSVYFVALSWAAARSGDAAQTGLVLAVGAVPRAALMLVGGVLADRFGPRRVVVGSDAVRCVVILAVAGVLLLSAPAFWLLASAALVFGVADALFLPGVGALPPRITAPGELVRVQGMRGLAHRAATVTSAPLGGAAVAFGGPAAGFAVAGLLFAVSLPLLLAVRIRELPADDVAGRAESPRRQLAGGLRYVRGHAVLAPLMIVIAVTEMGFSGPANVGLVLLADERGWGAAGMGWVVAGFGLGAGLASLLVALRGRFARPGAVLSWAALPGAAALAALPFVPSVAWGVLAALLVGLMLGLGGALAGALVQAVTDPAYLGRVTSVSGLLTLGVPPLCYPLTGVAVGAWGTGPVFVAGASVSALGGVVGLRGVRMRGADAEPMLEVTDDSKEAGYVCDGQAEADAQGSRGQGWAGH
ncbi:MFS transporter [Streptomyces aureocirculatus]|uniref:MFS transporter n=1 Tax=Streptomyces aureocirculatus TaxID=67275 RepID=UPI0007C5914E|nr:MFS transporter [Streptomyces aureocirculatus]